MSALGSILQKLSNNYILVAGAKMLGLALVSMSCTIAVCYLAASLQQRRPGSARKCLPQGAHPCQPGYRAILHSIPHHAHYQRCHECHDGYHHAAAHRILCPNYRRRGHHQSVSHKLGHGVDHRRRRGRTSSSWAQSSPLPCPNSRECRSFR